MEVVWKSQKQPRILPIVSANQDRQANKFELHLKKYNPSDLTIILISYKVS